MNLNECKLYGMKSHDFHLFMQTIIPIAYRELLPKNICDPLTKFYNFF